MAACQIYTPSKLIQVTILTRDVVDTFSKRHYSLVSRICNGHNAGAVLKHFKLYLTILYYVFKSMVFIS